MREFRELCIHKLYLPLHHAVVWVLTSFDLVMPECNYPNCDFNASEEYHVLLHHKLTHTQLQPIPMCELFDSIIKGITDGTEPILTFQLVRDDYLGPLLPKKNIQLPILDFDPMDPDKENTAPPSPASSAHDPRLAQLIPNSLLASGDISAVSYPFRFCRW